MIFNRIQMQEVEREESEIRGQGISDNEVEGKKKKAATTAKIIIKKGDIMRKEATSVVWLPFH